MNEPFVKIDLRALRTNFCNLKAMCTPSTKTIAVIKADAYGSGSVAVCKSLSSVDIFAVARLSEAIELREASVNRPILIFAGVSTLSDLIIAIKHDLTIVIHSQYQIDLLVALSPSLKVQCWVKYDSGMHRLGFNRHNFKRAIKTLENMSEQVNVMGVLSHFSSADNDSVRCKEQISDFQLIMGNMSYAVSFTNTAALEQGIYQEQNYARLGIGLYGVSPVSSNESINMNLQPVQTFIAFVLSVREHPAFEPVGYNGKWVSQAPTKLAVIGVGYADGYPTSISTGTPVLINGIKFPIVGKVSMDLISVDIGLSHNVQEGDEVTLWGKGLPVTEIATRAKVIPYELLTGISKRVLRVYENEG